MPPPYLRNGETPPPGGIFHQLWRIPCSKSSVENSWQGPRRSRPV